jgi:hypothetical protein
MRYNFKEKNGKFFLIAGETSKQTLDNRVVSDEIKEGKYFKLSKTYKVPS